jgi:DNA-binding transcriptional LysR family regulator
MPNDGSGTTTRSPASSLTVHDSRVASGWFGATIRHSDCRIRQEVDRACATAKIRLEICSETNSLAFAQMLAWRTDLATFLPRNTAMPAIEAGRIVAVPLRDPRLEATQVTLVQLASRNISPSCRMVADLLVARMKSARE